MARLAGTKYVFNGCPVLPPGAWLVWQFFTSIYKGKLENYGSTFLPTETTQECFLDNVFTDYTPTSSTTGFLQVVVTVVGYGGDQRVK